MNPRDAGVTRAIAIVRKRPSGYGSPAARLESLDTLDVVKIELKVEHLHIFEAEYEVYWDPRTDPLVFEKSSNYQAIGTTQFGCKTHQYMDLCGSLSILSTSGPLAWRYDVYHPMKTKHW